MKEPNLKDDRTYLNLTGRGVEVITALAPSLAKLTQLTSLDLGYNVLDAAACTALAPSLAKLTQLTTLHLSNTRLDAAAYSVLAPSLAKLTRLTTLDLSLNDLDAAACRALAPSLARLTQLTTLDLHGNFLDAAACSALAPSLEKLTQLTTLDLTNTRLSAAWSALAPSLAELTQLTSLNLSCNRPFAAACRALAPSLAMLTRLTSLNLSDNGLDAAACRALAPSLAQLTQLTTLHLIGNNLDAAACRALAPSLAQLTRLTTLDLRSNGLDAATLQTLDSIIDRNKQIQSITNYLINTINDFDTQTDEPKKVTDSYEQITKNLDKLYQFAKEIESQHQVTPTALYDTYYHLTCRLALISDDVDSAIHAAELMSTFPIDTLLPYANENYPQISAKLIRLLAKNVDDPRSMQKVLQILIQSRDQDSQSKADRYRLILRVAQHANPNGDDQTTNNLLQLMDLLPAKLKTHNTPVQQNPPKIIAYDQLLKIANGCLENNNPADVASLTDLITDALPYSIEREQKLLRHPLVSQYLMQQPNKTDTIYTYERLIHESYDEHKTSNENTQTLQETLLQLADDYEALASPGLSPG